MFRGGPGLASSPSYGSLQGSAKHPDTDKPISTIARNSKCRIERTIHLLRLAREQSDNPDHPLRSARRLIALLPYQIL